MPPQSSGRTLTFAPHAEGISNFWLGRQHFLHDDRVLPTVAKVIGVDRLRSDFAEHHVEVRGAFVADGVQPHRPVVGIGFPEPFLADAEVVQVREAIFQPRLAAYSRRARVCMGMVC